MVVCVYLYRDFPIKMLKQIDVNAMCVWLRVRFVCVCIHITDEENQEPSIITITMMVGNLL